MSLQYCTLLQIAYHRDVLHPTRHINLKKKLLQGFGGNIVIKPALPAMNLSLLKMNKNKSVLYTAYANVRNT